MKTTTLLGISYTLNLISGIVMRTAKGITLPITLTTTYALTNLITLPKNKNIKNHHQAT